MLEVTENQLNVVKEAPKLVKMMEQEKKEKKDTKEDKNWEENIEDISRKGDLSPRQTSQMKERMKKRT